VAHFPRFYDAMDAAQHIVKLGPCAVELVDRTMIELSRAIPAFAPTINSYVRASRMRSCWWSSRARTATSRCAASSASAS